MKKHWILALGISLLATSSLLAQGRHAYPTDNGIRFYGGLFEPDGESQYWRDNELDFTSEVSDFEDFTGGVEYVRNLRGNLRLMAGGTFYEGETRSAYRDFIDDRGDEILHDTTLTMQTAHLGLAVGLGPRSAPILPYLGIGAALYAWELEEAGDFIDFSGGPLEIFSTRFEDDGVTLGWYWVAGLEVPINSSLQLFAQGRWHHAEDELGGDFRGLDDDLDLSGRELTAGLTWRF